MSQSSERLDRLVFSWDRESSQKQKINDVPKITATTERHLEEYFAFLEDIDPSFTTQNSRSVPGLTAFTLD